MIILAIDTSCDDTSIAAIEIKNEKTQVLSNIISSQVEIHKKYGGVYPTLAKREHAKNLVLVLEKALDKAELLKNYKLQITNYKFTPTPNFGVGARNTNHKTQTLEKILERELELLKNLTKFLKKYQKPKVSAIAVTNGPGLEPCLWVGVNFAKALSYYWNLPIIPVNHIEGHIFANLLPQIGENPKSPARNASQASTCSRSDAGGPAICLVVSGGHTQLILMKKIGKYKILGETRDDAAGECFDKVARILGLGYPGGPAIAQQAEQWKLQITKHKTQTKHKFQITNYKFDIKLPRPMLYSKDYDFSFSGLKTAVLYDYKKRSPKIRKSKQYIQVMCAEVQQAVVDVLIKKTIKAAKDYRVKTIMLGGGVAANQELRQQLKYQLLMINYQLKFLAPPKIFCTDNAAMIGITAYFHRKKTKSWKNITVDANLRI